MRRLAGEAVSDEPVSEERAENRVKERAKNEPSDGQAWIPDAEEERRFLEAVRIGIEQTDRGEFIEEEEMDARVERMLRGCPKG